MRHPSPADLATLDALLGSAGDLARHRVIARARGGELDLPVVGVVLGTEDRTKPTLGIFAGVHGLERVGCAVVLAYFATVLELLRWDTLARRRLESCRLVLVPIVNPVGVALGRRANGAGVDLMRNAPVDAQDAPPPLIGGHRFGPWLPYYRGALGAPMQPEAEGVARFVREELFGSEAAIALDVHSGFGARDRLWYPYAKQRFGFPRAAEARRLGALLTRTLPNHVYRIEPQSHAYTTHGDLWDFLFDEHRARHGADGPLFLPWTLEMGSWAWARKNPRQLLRRTGLFHPHVPHRLHRTLRRHLALFDFLLRAVDNHTRWRSDLTL